MKNALLLMKRPFLMVVFVMISVFFVQVNCQSYPTLVNSDLAVDLLEEQLPVQYDLVESMNAGEVGYSRQLRKLEMYVLTYEEVVLGAEVEEALNQAFARFATTSSGRKLHLDELAVHAIEVPDNYLDPDFTALVELLTL